MPGSLTRDDGTPLLSFCVPTYNRAPKLERLLGEIERIISVSPYAHRVEVLVSNNASTDSTAAVIRAAQSRWPAGAAFHGFDQPTGLGPDGNFKFLYEQARGRYLWLCSDDDPLHVDQFDPMLEDLERFDPDVCISSFVNYASTKDQVLLPEGEQTRLVEDSAEAMRWFFALGKITQYVYRRTPLTSKEQQASDDAARTTAFWFLTLAVMRFVNGRRRLLLRTGVIAESDREVGNLRFSPRVYDTCKRAMLLGIGDDEVGEFVRRTFPDGPFNVKVLLVAYLFRHTVGWIRLDPAVARSDFDYLKRNLGTLMAASWRNVIKIPFVLLAFPLVDRLRRGR